MKIVGDGSIKIINSTLNTKYLKDLVSKYSPSRVFNLHIGTILNCETIVNQCIECNNKNELT